MTFVWTRSPLRHEIIEFLRLAIPLASAQIAQSAIGFADTLMMGRLGAETLAAGGLASLTFSAFVYTAMGLIMGISPLVAAAYGAGQQQRIAKITQQGGWLVLGLTIPLSLGLAHFDVLMRQLGQAETTVVLGNTYLDIMVWGCFPALGFALLRNVVAAMGQARPVMMIMMGGTLLNILGNYGLGFGKLGLPRWEIAGLALSSVIALWAMFLALIGYILWQPELRSYQLLPKLNRFDRAVFQELVRVGLSIGITTALEIGLFTTITYLMGGLGTVVLAAHQIVFQTVVIIFMVPLGISYAATVRVGYWVGKENHLGIQRAGSVGFVLGAGFMALMMIVLLTAPQQIIGIYLDLQDPRNASVVTLATTMLRVAACAQILDGLQKIAMGALYGLQDTHVPMILSLIAFWGVGLTSGYWLGFQAGWGGVGLWVGQSIGVAIGAVIFLWRFYQRTSLPRT